MAKIICCDKCKSINVNKIGEEERNRHTTKEEGWFGLGGSWSVMYHSHYNLYNKYECNECRYKFEELEYNC